MSRVIIVPLFIFSAVISCYLHAAHWKYRDIRAELEREKLLRVSLNSSSSKNQREQEAEENLLPKNQHQKNLNPTHPLGYAARFRGFQGVRMSRRKHESRYHATAMVVQHDSRRPDLSIPPSYWWGSAYIWAQVRVDRHNNLRSGFD